jgi:SAM-dependent methyltransferase
MADVNVEQARAWNGEEGDRWTEQEARYNTASRRHSDCLLRAARIAPGDQILDIGCGCGESTRDAARQARSRSGWALGVDLSARMLARARERSLAEGVLNARFELADVQIHPFAAQTFDLAISRFGAMFFEDPLAAFRNVGRALRPGGRLALIAWQELARNEWLLALRGALAAGRTLPEPTVGAPGPFGLADPAAVRQVLGAAGFVAIDFEEVNEPMEFGADPDDAFDFVRSMGVTKGLLESLDATARARAIDDVRAMLAAHHTDAGILLGARSWLITAHRP